jgi:hypothetical protein
MLQNGVKMTTIGWFSGRHYIPDELYSNRILSLFSAVEVTKEGHPIQKSFTLKDCC